MTEPHAERERGEQEGDEADGLERHCSLSRVIARLDRVISSNPYAQDYLMQ